MNDEQKERDYIEREEMSGALSELLESPYANGDTVFSAGSKDAIKLIKDMVDNKVSESLRIPSADVRNNIHGVWIYHISDIFPAESTKECSICHAEQCISCDDEFCPHCGADMRGKNDEV